MNRELSCVIVATGPSLTKEQCSLARVWRDRNPLERFVLAINNAWELCPWANDAYAADWDWFSEYGKFALQEFQGDFFTGDPQVKKSYGWAPRLHHVVRMGGTKLPADGASICTGGTNGHSGFQALCLAAQHGAGEIFLLGFDGKHGADGRTHCHLDHPKPLHNASHPERWLSPMGDLASQFDGLGVKVTNLSPDTAYICFKRGSAAECLAF